MESLPAATGPAMTEDQQGDGAQGEAGSNPSAEGGKRASAGHGHAPRCGERPKGDQQNRRTPADSREHSAQCREPAEQAPVGNEEIGWDDDAAEAAGCRGPIPRRPQQRKDCGGPCEAPCGRGLPCGKIPGPWPCRREPPAAHSRQPHCPGSSKGGGHRPQDGGSTGPCPGAPRRLGTNRNPAVRAGSACAQKNGMFGEA